jgi:Protein of unknown function (DUF2442)
MKSAARGKPTSEVEITNVSKHGFWILVQDRELFAPFKVFPWFKRASVGEILNVEMPGPNHLHWPDLDIDLAVESIENPKAFPLVSRALPNKALQPTSRAQRPKRPRKRSSAARG